MADVVIQSQSTLFRRQGETRQYKYYTMPSVLYSNLLNAQDYSTTSNEQNAASHAALYNLLVQNSEIIPGGLTLYDVQALDPSLFPAAGELETVYQQDPFGTAYEAGTEALYARSYAVARAAAQSGPVNVRGGTARVAFEMAELDTLQSINRFREVWQNQVAMAGVVVQAAQVANSAEGARRADQLRAQQQQATTEQGRVMQTLGAAEQLTRDRDVHIRAMAACGEFTGVPQMWTTEGLYGEGFQQPITTSFGMSSWR